MDGQLIVEMKILYYVCTLDSVPCFLDVSQVLQDPFPR